LQLAGNDAYGAKQSSRRSTSSALGDLFTIPIRRIYGSGQVFDKHHF